MSSVFNSNGLLVLDGAMGTELIERGLKVGEPTILWNIEHPDQVIAVHRAYVSAGCDFLTTNTFGGSGMPLTRAGLIGRVEELNQAAVDLAKIAAEGRCLVLGDIGPCGELLEPYGDATAEQVRQSVLTQGRVLAEAGVDGFIVETMSDVTEAIAAVRALVPLGLPVGVTFAFEKCKAGFRTLMGNDVQESIRPAIDAGAATVGANCGNSLNLDDYIALARTIVSVAGSLPVAIQPNAGSPPHYERSLERFARWAAEVRDVGVKMLGGCCGTNPEVMTAICSARQRLPA